MYHFMVKRRIRALFHQANQGNFQAIIDGLAENFVYRFVGDTPLGGTRTRKASMKAWFERIYRLVPDAQFTPQAIVVEGLPWNTRIMTYVKFNGTMPPKGNETGRSYENEVMQMIGLRWGRMTSVLTIEDTHRFTQILPELAAAGILDATAAPIDDMKPDDDELA